MTTEEIIVKVPSYINTKPLFTADPMYDTIANLVRTSYPTACIAMIDEITIPGLKEAFQQKKDDMLPGFDKEVVVYHGTKKQYIEPILQNNFRPDLGKTQAYGKGTYFAKNFGYSWSYSDGETKDDPMSYIFICTILPGKMCIGSSDRLCPLGYNSQVDSITSPSIYAIPTAEQILPQYLVRFHKNSERGEVKDPFTQSSGKILAQFDAEAKRKLKKMEKMFGKI